MKKVLLIDRDIVTTNIVTKVLEDVKVVIIKADNVLSGAQMARENKFDLVITDIIDPLADLPFLQEMKEINPETFVLVLSEDVSRNTIQRAYQHGCSGFLPKPLNKDSFLSVIVPFLAVDNVNEPSYKKTYYQSDNDNVLIVDDNLMNAELLKAILEQLNINSVIALNGESALNLINEQTFDLILLDIMMPEMSGFEVIKKIKDNHVTKDIPVIFVSAINDPKDVVKGFDLGSFAYVKKPFNTEELKAQVVNILKIKKLQDSLKLEKDKLDTIFEYAIDGIILMDENFAIRSCNRQFLKWLNLKDEKEIIGKKVCEVAACENFNIENLCKCVQELSTGKDFIQANTVMVLGNTKRHVKHSISKFYDKSGNLKGYLGLIIDISKDMEIEQQKETFIATLTHDLKTPIRAEMRAMELLLNGSFGALSQEQSSIIREIFFSSKFMFNMVDTLLANYRYENGNVVLVKEDTDINALIKSCHNEIKYIIDEKHHAVIFDFENEHEIVPVDVMEMKRLILNLFTNAINYTQERGKITIRSRRVDNQLQVSFEDNGHGIPKDKVDHIFEKYNTNAKKLRHVGTGLGLYISKKIVELHDGYIKVESKENVGSCFTFAIPLLPVSAVEKHALVS